MRSCSDPLTLSPTADFSKRMLNTSGSSASSEHEEKVGVAASRNSPDNRDTIRGRPYFRKMFISDGLLLYYFDIVQPHALLDRGDRDPALGRDALDDDRVVGPGEASVLVAARVVVVQRQFR